MGSCGGLRGVILESKSVPNGFHSNEILGGFATSAGSECFRGSGSGWETERTRFRLVTRVCSSFIVPRSSFTVHCSSFISHFHLSRLILRRSSFIVHLRCLPGGCLGRGGCLIKNVVGAYTVGPLCNTWSPLTSHRPLFILQYPLTYPRPLSFRSHPYPRGGVEINVALFFTTFFEKCTRCTPPLHALGYRLQAQGLAGLIAKGL